MYGMPMTDSSYPSGRLIKVLLPSHLVGAMDEVIAASGSYASRSEFVADAIDGHLAELRAQQAVEGVSGPRLERTNAAPGVMKPRAPVAAILSVSGHTPTVEHLGSCKAEPTWGMHNRDFPTLWALTHLSRATHATGEPVAFVDWLPEVVTDAWDLGRRLPTDKFDLSGFPTNAAKREASEGRFVKFFIGDGPGMGPLFDLGLAGSDEDGRVAPTPAGLVLLTEIEGFSCERGRGIPQKWTRAYLRHIARYAPADLAFMSEVLAHIRSGEDDRTRLMQATADTHPDWSESVVDTNVAGFIARSREWGLLLPRQHKGRYAMEDAAMELLEQAKDA